MYKSVIPSCAFAVEYLDFIKIKMLCFMFFAVTLYNFLVTCLNERILLCFQSINNNKTYEQFCFLNGWLVGCYCVVNSVWVISQCQSD